MTFENSKRKRPRLLYLAYFFRPAEAIACVRTWNTAVHLTRLGWDVQVVTPAPELWIKTEDIAKVDEDAANAGITRILTGHDWPMLVHGDIKYPKDRLSWFVGGLCRRAASALRVEAQFGWAAAAARACANFREGDIDCILATGSPYISFRLAKRLAKRLRCPYVLDYRDPWNGNPHAESPEIAKHVREEVDLLKACNAVTVVSPSWAALLDERYGVASKAHVISNGYDPAMFANVKQEVFDHFAVVYAGTLYPPKRVLDTVLEAFRESLKTRSRSMRFHYYGSHASAVRAVAQRLGIEEHVQIHGNVPRAEALAAQKGADVVVVIASVEERGTLADNGIVTGKVFDCLALERPTLVVAPLGSDMYEIAVTTGGMRCFTGNNVPDMTDFLLRCARGETPMRTKPELYQWKTIGARLDSLLHTLIDKKSFE